LSLLLLLPLGSEHQTRRTPYATRQTITARV
jgi:hypothetical protein